MTTSKPIANPPIVELVLGLQFDACPALAPMQLGAVAQGQFPGFSRWAQRPPLEPNLEVYPATPQGAMALFRIVPQERTQRSWLMTPDEERLLQVQEDRLILNWRKSHAGANYPGYETLLAEFLGHWAKVQVLRGPEALPPNHLEISYINLFHGDKPKVSDFLRIQDELPVLGGWEQEHQSWTKQVAVMDEQKAFVGRVYLEADNRWDDAGQPCVRLVSTARALPQGKLRERFDHFHGLLIQAFRGLCQPHLLA